MARSSTRRIIHRRMSETYAPASVAETKEGWPPPATSPMSQLRCSPSSPSGWQAIWWRARGGRQTELAKALSRASGRDLLLLQCYEGSMRRRRSTRGITATVRGFRLVGSGGRRYRRHL